MDALQNTRRGFLNRIALGSGILLSGCNRSGPAAKPEAVSPTEPADVTLRITPVLVDIAKDGRRGTSRVLIGSVTQRVLDYAPCPILVTR